MGPVIPRALVVDDDPDLLELASTYLGERGGLEILIAASGEQALDRLEGYKVDVVISDYQMPGMDGIELLKIVRERYGDIPFILFTGRGREEVVIQALNEGADFYLQKGGDLKVQFAELEHKIWRAIRSHRSDQELRESRAFINTVLDNLPLGIAVNSVVPRVQFEYVNENFLRFYRISRESLSTPDSFWEAVYEDPVFREGIRDRVREDCASGVGERMHWEDVPITREGEETTYVSAMNIPFDDNRFMISVVWDVTERKRAEDRLRTLAEEYEKVFHGTQDALFLVEVAVDGFRYIRNNRAHELATGIPLDVIRGKTPQELLGGELGERVASNYDRCVKSSSTISYDEELDLPIGRRVWHTTLTPISHEGEAAYIIGSSHDITEKRRVEERLRESEELYRGVVSAINEGILVQDRSGRIIACNQAAQRIFGMDEEEILGSTSVSRDWGAYREDGSEYPGGEHPSMRTLRTLEPCTNEVMGLRRRSDSRWVWLNVSTRPVFREGDREPWAVVISFSDITDRKEAELALTRMNQVLTRSQEMAQIGSWEFERATRSLTLSDELCRILGNETKERIDSYESLLERVHPEDLQSADEAIRRSIYDGSDGFEIHHRIVREDDGEVRFIHVRCVHERDASGDLVRSVGIMQDVTDRTRAQEALRRSEERYRTIFENTNSAMAVIEGDMTFSLVNDEFARLTGYDKEEVEGKTISTDLVAPGDRGRLEGYHRRRRRDPGSAPREYEFQILTKEGEIKDCQAVISMVPGTEQSIVSVIDLSELKRMQRELVDKNLEQERILDNIDVQVWYATEPGTYGMVNKARANFLGLTKEEMVGRSLSYSIGRRDELRICLESNLKAFQGEKVVQEEWLTTTTGETKCVLVSKIPVLNEQGEVEYIVCTATDIDRLKALEGALRLANEKISILFGVTRHDVLNQLAVITGYLGLLRDPSRRGSLDQYLDRMESAANRIMGHLEFTMEVETMGGEPPRWMRPSEAINEALSKLDLEALKVQIDGSLDTIHIFCDTLFWKVFYNLLHNTLEHAEGATSISIRTEQANGGLRVVYEDDGPGIPGEMRRKLFDFGVGKTGGGGLYLVKRILSLYDMDIGEDGERGARFTIQVPPHRYRAT